MNSRGGKEGRGTKDWKNGEDPQFTLSWERKRSETSVVVKKSTERGLSRLSTIRTTIRPTFRMAWFREKLWEEEMDEDY